MKRTALAILLLAVSMPVRAEQPAPTLAPSEPFAEVRWWSNDDAELTPSSQNTASPSEAPLSVADTITRTIRITTDPGVSVEWPASLIVGGELGGMTISSIHDAPPRIDTQGRLVQARTIALEPFLPGDMTIGPLDFVMRHEGGRSRTVTLPAQTLTITPLLPPDTKPELIGPKGVVEAPPTDSGAWLPWAVGGSVVFVLAASAMTVFLMRRARRERAPLSPKHRALAALAILDDSVRGEARLGHRPSNERVYTDLSRILREYVEERFDRRAMTRTTEEFLLDATRPSEDLPEAAVERLRAVLEACDEVKFGAIDPGLAAAGRAIDEVRGFVESFGDRAEVRS